jgi:hypothetical protein
MLETSPENWNRVARRPRRAGGLHLRRPLRLAVVLALAGCASGNSYRPKDGPDDVTVYVRGADAPQGYTVIETVRANKDNSSCTSPIDFPLEPGSDAEEVLTELRARAAELGADAIVNVSLGCGRGGAAMGRAPDLNGTATAVVYVGT